MANLPQPEAKKQFVREKFAAISPHYDFLNSLLSLRIDSLWRRRVARLFQDVSGGWMLDLCAGTLPLSLALARKTPARILAVDFCADMLRAGLARLPGDEVAGRIHPVCGDGEQLPVATASCAGCTIAFGIRNLSHADRGLAEMHRILRPGGRLVILEFSRPANPVVKPVYNFYLNTVLPAVAGRISGDRDAYRYLAASIAAFHEPETLMAMMRQAGFAGVRRVPLTFGIVSLYIGEKED